MGGSVAGLCQSESRYADYELVRYFTAGGMADLYLVRSLQEGVSDRHLVLKRIQQRYLDHTHVVQLFLDEGRIAQTLTHPNIVQVVDVGEAEGNYYIAMEYIAGHDLVAIARRGIETGKFLPRPLAVGLVQQVAAGLAYAHTHTDSAGHPLSIVHCDISPGNIVVSWRGTAKIVDFGIARAAIALRKEDGVAGKYNYMAPEQIRGEDIDARADLFSLGVILWELTLGKRLFRGKPEIARHKVLEEPIPQPRDLSVDYPEELATIVMRLLERDRDRRYSSAAAVSADLRSFLRTTKGGWYKQDVALYLRDLFQSPPSESARDAEFGPLPSEEMVVAMPALAEAGGEIEIDPETSNIEQSVDGAPQPRAHLPRIFAWAVLLLAYLALLGALVLGARPE